MTALDWLLRLYATEAPISVPVFVVCCVWLMGMVFSFLAPLRCRWRALRERDT